MGILWLKKRDLLRIEFVMVLRKFLKQKSHLLKDVWIVSLRSFLLTNQKKEKLMIKNLQPRRRLKLVVVVSSKLSSVKIRVYWEKLPQVHFMSPVSFSNSTLIHILLTFLETVYIVPRR